MDGGKKACKENRSQVIYTLSCRKERPTEELKQGNNIGRLPLWHSGKESTGNAGEAGDAGSIPWVGKIPWSRRWQPTSVFLPGKSHGHKSLVDSSPWGHKVSDTTEHTQQNNSRYAFSKQKQKGKLVV